MALSPVSFPDRALASSRGNQHKTQRTLWIGLKQFRKQESTLLLVCRWPHRDRNGKPIVLVAPFIKHHMVLRFLGLYSFMVVSPLLCGLRFQRLHHSVWGLCLISCLRGASGHKVGYGWGRVRVRIRPRALLPSPSPSLRSRLTDLPSTQQNTC